MALIIGLVSGLRTHQAVAVPLNSGVQAAKHCKTVTKKVHGHKKRVKVCKLIPPRATPTPQPTSPPALFSGPEDVIVDGQGNIYVADSGNQTVDKLSADGHVLSRWSDSGSGHFSEPYGLALDGHDHLYVADNGDNQIVELSLSGQPISHWSTPGGGSDPDRASSIAVDPQGNVYVPADNHQHINKFGPTGQIAATIGAAGTGPGQFAFPFAVTVDTQGNVYVADSGNGQIQELSASGAFITRWGEPGSPVQLSDPEGLKVDGQGNIYVAEARAHRVLKFSRDGTVLGQWGGGAGSVSFSHPTGVALDTQGNIYVADFFGNRIDKLSPTGQLLAQCR
jgi:DNA-binding beta-propeller fold protein YncE